ncbi:MAG: SpoIIE family protein phosphatase [Janthinobacterium lividum]
MIAGGDRFEEPGAGPDYRSVFAAVPTPCLLIDADFVVVECNPAHSAVTGRRREDLVGRGAFEAFPGNPENPGGAGAYEVAVRTAMRTGLVERLPLVEHDSETAPGFVAERWWTVVLVPVHREEDGTVTGVISIVDDLSDLVRERDRVQQAEADVAGIRERAEQLASDLDARSVVLDRVARAEALSSRRLAGLAGVALELASAQTVEQLTSTVIDRGLAVLGADGGAIAFREDAGDTRSGDPGQAVLRLVITDSLVPLTRPQSADIPLDGPLPAAVAARTGVPVLLRDQAEGLALTPEMAEVNATTGRVAWAALPLRVGDRLLGSITASWSGPQTFPDGDVAFMRAFAAQCAQALDRMLVRQAEQATAAATSKLAIALQRSLLTDPVQPDHLEIAVRYVPAAEEAQVGGDWYDAFTVTHGATTLVIGDVAGHDRHAAAAMAQVRNVLRGVAHAVAQPPARVLGALDRAMADLGIGALATAVLAQVEEDDANATEGMRTLRWSNAGHPPPLLLEPDGRARLLSTVPELLLGLLPDTERHDHTQVLVPGSTVLFYTDGLVERRGQELDAGLEWLRRRAEDLVGRTLEEFCDALLADVGSSVEDDVALLAVRAHPQDRARPVEAGPNVDAEDLRGETAL